MQDVRQKAAVFVADSAADLDTNMGDETLSSFRLNLHDIPPDRQCQLFVDMGTGNDAFGPVGDGRRESAVNVSVNSYWRMVCDG